MLFLATEFEQSFSAKALKQGLRLFEQDEVSLQEKNPGGHFRFLVDDNFPLILKKRGDKVLSSACSCDESTFCCHLSAVLFYFQRDALGIVVKKRATSKAKPRINKVLVNENFEILLKNASQAQLIHFISSYSELNDLFRQSVETFFSANSEEAVYKFYSLRIKTILEPYQDHNLLEQKQLDAIGRVLSAIYDTIKNRSEDDSEVNGEKYENDLCYLHLAIVSGLPLIFDQRMSGHETELSAIFFRSLKAIPAYYNKNVSEVAVAALLKATVDTINIKNKMGLEAFGTLIPLTLNFIKQKEKFTALKSALNKKRNKTIHPGQFDRLAIARLQLAIKEAELFNTAFAFKDYRNTPEFVMAEAELLFAAHKTDKAFKKLEDFYEDVKINFKGFLIPYLAYLTGKGAEQSRPDIELKYLTENMVHGLFISPAQADRFFDLVPVTEQVLLLNQILERIKVFAKDQSLDKVSLLLLRAGRLNDLVTEIKKYKNKFSLLHKIALQKLPEAEDDFITLYTRQLIQALTDGAYDHYHEQIFMNAKKYLDHLPPEKVNTLVQKVLASLAAFSHLHRFISEIYPEKLFEEN